MSTTVIVTSVLNPVNRPLDRVEQSINTINSIRKRLGDVRIIFVDCSVALPVETTRVQDTLRAGDQFIDLSKDDSVMTSVVSANKSYGELVLLDWAISNLSFDGDIFKISGRYYLDDAFDFGILDKNADINCKARGFAHANNVCLTTFYRMKDRDIFTRYTTHAKILFQRYPSISAEHVLFNFMSCNQDLKIQNLDRIGVVGQIAVSGETHYN